MLSFLCCKHCVMTLDYHCLVFSENIYEHSVRRKQKQELSVYRIGKTVSSFSVSAWSLISAENAIYRISPSVSERREVPAAIAFGGAAASVQ